MTRNQRIMAFLAAILVVVQFIPVSGRQDVELASANDMLNVLPADYNTSSVIRQACYDCHSIEVKYPWYSNVAPLSWWIQHHINEGRHEANFSQFGALSMHDRDHVLKECADMLSKDEMPLKSYTWLHPEARLTLQEKEMLLAFFRQNRAGGED